MLRAGDRLSRDVERLMRDGVDPPGGDGRLLQRFLEDRDQSAFEAIVDRHGPLVLSLCRRYLREPADVEDAFQATFLVLVRKGPGLRDPDALSSWLYGVAHRVAARARSDALKRRSREGTRDGVGEAVDGATASVDDSLEVLDAELSRLPEKYRAPLVLCYLRGRTHDQAAAELGWPVGTVRSRMAKARSILHDRLSRRGLDASACLAAARLDLASAVVPSSLVAATASAAGRFAALASGLGWIWRAHPSSTTWPAAALAEGVLSRMTTAPWKLLGLAFLSTGLTAGALAFTGGPQAEPAQPEEPPKHLAQPDSKAGAQAAEMMRHVEARLSDVEQKLDRLMRLMEKPAVTAGADAPAIGGTANAASSGSNIPKGLREIEAELVNNYQHYDHTNKLVEKQVVSRNELSMLVAPARLLVARLRDMEAEALREESRAKRRARHEDRDKLQQELDQAKKDFDAAKETATRAGLSVEDLELSVIKQLDRANSGFGTNFELSEAIKKLDDLQSNPARKAAFFQYRKAQTALQTKKGMKDELDELNRQYEESRARTLAIQKLIKWAKERFKDVELTIDDAAKSE